MPTCGSPWLFAAYRVLRRQSVPWHPPCALVRLIFASSAVLIFLRLLRNENSLKFVVRFFPVQFSRCVEGSHESRFRPAASSRSVRSFKTIQKSSSYHSQIPCRTACAILFGRSRSGLPVVPASPSTSIFSSALSRFRSDLVVRPWAMIRYPQTISP